MRCAGLAGNRCGASCLVVSVFTCTSRRFSADPLKCLAPAAIGVGLLLSALQSASMSALPLPSSSPLCFCFSARRVFEGFSPGVTGSRAAPCCASHTFLPALARTSFSQLCLCWLRTGLGCPRQCVGSLGQSLGSTDAYSCARGEGCVIRGWAEWGWIGVGRDFSARCFSLRRSCGAGTFSQSVRGVLIRRAGGFWWGFWTHGLF